MTAPFECAMPRRVLFGRGRVGELGELARAWGRRAAVFCGAHPERHQPALDVLAHADVKAEVIPVAGEPTFDGVRSVTDSLRAAPPDVVVAIGGGSVIDSAKAVAMLLANGGDPLDYAEVIGRGQPVTRASLPFIAVPTTAGAGAEATRNAVLVDRARGAKVSLRSHLMLPEAVLIDPDLTRDLPPAITAATGMDALSQLIEAFVSIKANPFTDALARAGIARAARALPRVCAQPGDLEAREDMALAAWWSGIALAHAGLGAVHGFAAALGGRIAAPHGLICARFLAPVCRANIAALRACSPAHPALARYDEIARLLVGDERAGAEDGTDWLTALAASLPLEELDGLGALNEDDVIAAAQDSSSMKGNPVALPREALAGIWRLVGRRVPSPPR